MGKKRGCGCLAATLLTVTAALVLLVALAWMSRLWWVEELARMGQERHAPPEFREVPFVVTQLTPYEAQVVLPQTSAGPATVQHLHITAGYAPQRLSQGQLDWVSLDEPLVTLALSPSTPTGAPPAASAPPATPLDLPSLWATLLQAPLEKLTLSNGTLVLDKPPFRWHGHFGAEARWLNSAQARQWSANLQLAANSNEALSAEVQANDNELILSSQITLGPHPLWQELLPEALASFGPRWSQLKLEAVASATPEGQGQARFWARAEQPVAYVQDFEAYAEALDLSGQGQLSLESPWQAMQVFIDIHDLQLSNPALRLSMTPCQARLALQSLAPPAFAAPLTAGPTDLTVGKLTLRQARFSLDVQPTANGLALEAFADGQILGGEVTLHLRTAWQDQLAPIDLTAEFHHIELAEVVKLMPDFNGEIAGQLSGELRLRHNGRSLRPLGGSLDLAAETTGVLRLNQSGLYSGLSQRQIEEVLATHDFLSLMQRPDGQSILIEQAERNLQLTVFRVELRPNDPKPIHIHYEGTGEVKGVPVPIIKDIPIGGDIAEYINFGLGLQNALPKPR